MTTQGFVNRMQDEFDAGQEFSQQQNPFTAVKVLSGHSDIVRTLTRLDEKSFVSYGDDGKILVWDIESGSCVHALETKSRRVTCALLLQLDDRILLTASSDKTIRVWHSESGSLKKEIKEHGSSVRCLVAILYNDVQYFCSGGDDLCLWSKEGDLLHKLHPTNDDSCIHTLLAVRNGRLIAATNSLSLDGYQLVINDEKPSLESYIKKMPSHRDAIRCLIPIGEAMFASGSLDGAIYFWSSHTITVARKLNQHENYYDYENKLYRFSVNQLISCGEYVFAAVGNGFQVFSSSQPEKTALLIDQQHAHKTAVNSLAYNELRNIVITCSQDARIRLWEVDIEAILRAQTQRKNFMPPVSKYASFIGELMGHSGGVLSVISFRVDGFASCGDDALVLLWKEGARETRKRLELLQHKTHEQCEVLTALMMNDGFKT
ncbi:WD repeat-containing protein 41-like [Corticium candelabrum]|uniref:WD repeat-containing protein 41-like n=1 Tax=Corticium candelabrum TaxID=121492 RepID=UPI002E25AECD|nr:WD repeat-containing protein 41-like [Corticium candelabrum]